MILAPNGELVLGNKKQLVCCSTAAGPAFEGAKIECGMRGADGAIDHVFWDENGFHFSVIGNCEPKGICGSGLIDTIACLRKQGLIDEMGHMLSYQEAMEICGATAASHITQKQNMTAFYSTLTFLMFILPKKMSERCNLRKALFPPVFCFLRNILVLPTNKFKPYTLPELLEII